VEVIVTGGNSGVGEATAAALAAAGHSVVIACRTIQKAERAAATMAGDVAIAHLDGRSDQRAKVRRLGGRR
jgi:NAD(P)-dependent dehydrogenase (short-subunit alcohol dehydrogenase family)